MMEPHCLLGDRVENLLVLLLYKQKEEDSASLSEIKI